MCEWLFMLMLLFNCDLCGDACYAHLGISHHYDNYVFIELANTCPVRGVQFTVTGCSISEVQTTGRAEGFFAKYNEHNGTVVLVSLSGDKISPGKGDVAVLVFDGECWTASLSDIKISYY